MGWTVRPSLTNFGQKLVVSIVRRKRQGQTEGADGPPLTFKFWQKLLCSCVAPANEGRTVRPVDADGAPPNSETWTEPLRFW